MKVKEESEKDGLGLNIQKTKIMTLSPNTLWQIEGEKVETVTDFIFFACKITAGRRWPQPWNLKIFAPWKESYDEPGQHIKKERSLCQQKSI